MYLYIYSKGPFPSSPGPLFQNDKGRCSAFDEEIIFYSHANKTHFHKKGCAPSLISKVRVFGTRKWPIEFWQPVCHTGKATGSAKVFLCTLFFCFVFVLFSPYFTCLLSKIPSKACVTTWQQKQKVKWLFF